MTDLALSSDNGLVLDGNRDLALVSGTDEVTQTIRVALLTQAGEWFLDESYGVRWHEDVFVRNPNPAVIAAAIRTTILRVPNVNRILEYEQVIGPARQLTVTFKVDTAFGIASAVVSI